MFAKRTIGAVAIAVAFGISGSSAYAATLLYDAASATNGLSIYPGDLVETFTVNQTGLAVTSLAAYDSGKNGIAASTTGVWVGLFDNTANSVAIAAVNFGGVGGTAYNGGGSYFDTIALGSSYSLINGHTYSIEAWGFNGVNTSYYLVGGGGATFNPSTYALTDVPGTLAVGNGATNVDGTTTGGLVNALCDNTSTCVNSPRYLRFNGTDFAAAGSLVIIDTTSTDLTTPLPAALPLFASGLGALGLLGWRRKRKALAA
jgi:hypothetical protein